MPKEIIELKYGKTVQKISVPSRNIVCVARSRRLPTGGEEEAKIAEAIDNPIESPSIEELASPNRKVAVIIDDVTRSTPIHKILPILLERLREAGVRRRNIVLVMATGAHEEPPQHLLKKKLGEEATKNLKIQIHNCLDKENLTMAGFSSFGTPIWINRWVAEADVKIGVGGIIPHPWAGFGGGAKIILPGVSSWEAIGRNHMLAASSGARIGKIEGNPVRADMEEVAGKVGLDMIINTVLDDEGRIVDVVAGDYIYAHRKGVELNRKMFEHKVDGKVDVLILAYGPKDETLWNVMMGKFVGTIEQIPKDEGTVIIVAECGRGIYQYGGLGHVDYSGKLTDYSGVIELLKSRISPEEIFSKTVRGEMPYPEVGIKAYLIAKLARTKNVIIVSHNLKEKDVDWLGKVTDDAQKALDEALQRHGGDCTIAVIPSFGSSQAYIRRT